MIRVEAVDASTAPDETLLTINRIEESYDHRTPDEALAYMRHAPADERRLYWLAYDGDEPIGMARLNMHEESSLPWLRIAVLPAHRRRGAGRALLAAARAAAGDKPIGAHYVHEDGAAFARAMGARDDQRDVRSTLDLTTAALPDAPLPAGYRLRSWVGATPADIVESSATARNAVADAPHPEEQMPAWTAARVRELEAALARRGRETRVTVALHGDEVVAYTELRLSPPPAQVASTEDTATVREHRGRGLCRAVKVESLRRLRADRPDVQAVITLNAESNAVMRRINTSLGFVPVVTLTATVLAAP